MKLRTQLALLTAGIIVVPFLVSAILLLVRFLEMRANAADRERTLLMTPWMAHGGARSERLQELRHLAEIRPAGMEVVIISPDDTVEFSTIPGFAAGAPVNEMAVLQFLRDNDRASIVRGDSGSPLYLVRFPPPAPGQVQVPTFLRLIRSRESEVVVYTSLALLVVSMLASFWIVRRFGSSVRRLEAATRRVADGELDYALPARGNDEVSSLTRSFDRMRAALKEEYARRARFIMGVSHDLRTPLGLIKGYVEAVSDGYAEDPATRGKYLGIVQDKVRVLDGMVGDLIELVRMETGEWKLTHQRLRVAGYLRSLGQRYAEDAKILHRRFSHSVELPEDLEVSCDEALLTRALENLLGNALRYTPEDGLVELEAGLEAGKPVLTVRDTGIGIPAEDLPMIFDHFYRGTNSRREPGFGLGLATVKTIVEGHGWTIDVHSRQGRGTEFRIVMDSSAR